MKWELTDAAHGRLTFRPARALSCQQTAVREARNGGLVPGSFDARTPRWYSPRPKTALYCFPPWDKNSARRAAGHASGSVLGSRSASAELPPPAPLPASSGGTGVSVQPSATGECGKAHVNGDGVLPPPGRIPRGRFPPFFPWSTRRDLRLRR